MTKMKDLIFKGTNGLMGITLILSALSVDETSWIPTILCGVSAVWLLFTTYIESEGDCDDIHS